MPITTAQPFHPDPLPLRPIRRGIAPANLPRPLTSFVGRRREIADVHALLGRDDVRLLTLTGPGGVGKTRLAVQATASERRFPDGVWFVPLASLHDASLVIPAIATELGLGQTAARTPEEDLRAFLCELRALLVLDNLEHVVSVGPRIIALLTDCPALNVLTTSRVLLRVSGEFVYEVPPLPVPDAPAGLDGDAPADAVRLFVERAEASTPGFALTTENAADVVEICRRLDGLPLAIELAAARTATLPVHTVRNFLQRRLAILTGGPHDAPDRLRTMRNAIAWSHDLLDEREQMVFRRLAVFTGGFSLDAAACVLHDTRDVLDGVISLAEKHLLVRADGAEAAARFTMLETVREYGLEQLAASGEEAETRGRHAACFLAQAVAADFSWFMPLEEGLPIINGLEVDHANLRAAHDWFVETGAVESELRLAGTLGSLWVILGHCREGEAWLEQALDRGRAADPALRAKAMVTLGWAVEKLGQLPRAVALHREGLRLFRDLGEPHGILECLILSGSANSDSGDYDRCADVFGEALRLVDALDGPPWTRNAAATILDQLAVLAFRRGEIEEAERLWAQSLGRQRALGYAPGASHIYGNHALGGLGDIARVNGDLALAMRHYQATLILAQRCHDAGGTVRTLGCIAGTLAVAGKYAQAATLFGATETAHEAIGYPFAKETFDRQRAYGLPEPCQRADEPIGVYQPLRDRLQARVHMPIPPIPNPAAAARAWAAGKALSLAAAVSLALDARLPTEPEPDPFAGLSHREREVLLFLVDGRSNREIAETLSLSLRTVENHVQHILTKLNVDSRTTAATYAVRHGLV